MQFSKFPTLFLFRSHTDVIIPAKQEDEEEIDSTVYLCNFCSSGWFSETEVEMHRANNHKEIIADLYRSTDKHVCRMCIREFVDQDTMVRHIKSEHLLSSETASRVEREIFICETCGEIFFNKLLLIQHIFYAHHRKDNHHRFTCPNCFKLVNARNSWAHFRNHDLQSISACKICCVRFKNKKHLSEHLKSHLRLYKCELCRYASKKEKNYITHLNTVHKKSNEIPDLTSSVDKFYMPRTDPVIWKKHNLMGWRGVRLTNNIRICVLCREICLNKESMAHHILVEHDNKKIAYTNYMCSCGVSFQNKVLLKHHLFKFKETDHSSVYVYKM